MGENLVAHLELHGGLVTPLPAPQQIVWSDKGVTRESLATVRLHFEVTGCAVGKDLTFYILPWETAT